MLTRKLVVLSAVLALGAFAPHGALAGDKRAGKASRARVLVFPYDAPCGVSQQQVPYGNYVYSCPFDGRQFYPREGERRVTIRAVDDSGRPASVNLEPFNPAIGPTGPTTSICGSAALTLVPGQTYWVNPVVHIGDTGCLTPPTSGVIRITLTR